MVFKVKDLRHVLQILDPETYVCADVPMSAQGRMAMICAILNGYLDFVFEEVMINDRKEFCIRLTADGYDDDRFVIHHGIDGKELLKKNAPQLYEQIFDYLENHI